jgi:hypothetical protein
MSKAANLDFYTQNKAFNTFNNKMREDFNLYSQTRNESTLSIFKTYMSQLGLKFSIVSTALKDHSELAQVFTNIDLSHKVDKLYNQYELLEKSVLTKKMPISNDVIYDAYYIYSELRKIQKKLPDYYQNQIKDSTGLVYDRLIMAWDNDSMSLSLKDTFGSALNRNYILAMNRLRYKYAQINALESLIMKHPVNTELHNSKYGYRLEKVDCMLRDISMQLLWLLSSSRTDERNIVKYTNLLETLYILLKIRESDRMNYITNSIKIEQLYWDNIDLIRSMTQLTARSSVRKISDESSRMITYINSLGKDEKGLQNSSTTPFFVDRISNVSAIEKRINSLKDNRDNLERYESLLGQYKIVLTKIKNPSNITIDDIYDLNYIKLSLDTLDTPDSKTMSDMIQILIDSIPNSSYKNKPKARLELGDTVLKLRYTPARLDTLEAVSSSYQYTVSTDIKIKGTESSKSIFLGKRLLLSNKLAYDMSNLLEKIIIPTGQKILDSNQYEELSSLITKLSQLSNERITGDFKEYIRTGVQYELLYFDLLLLVLNIQSTNESNNLKQFYTLENRETFESSENTSDLGSAIRQEIESQNISNLTQEIIRTSQEIDSGIYKQILIDKYNEF